LNCPLLLLLLLQVRFPLFPASVFFFFFCLKKKGVDVVESHHFLLVVPTISSPFGIP
jgi:hypothetical protein